MIASLLVVCLTVLTMSVFAQTLPIGNNSNAATTSATTSSTTSSTTSAGGSGGANSTGGGGGVAAHNATGGGGAANNATGGGGAANNATGGGGAANNATGGGGAANNASGSGNGTAIQPLFDPEQCKEDIYYNLHAFMKCLDKALWDVVSKDKNNQTLVTEFEEMHKCFNKVSVDASTKLQGADDKEFKEEINECMSLNGHGGGIGDIPDSPHPVNGVDGSTSESGSEVLTTTKIPAILFSTWCLFVNKN